MIEPTISWVQATKKAVKSLQERYKQNRGMLLTEGDLECHLFNELMRQPELSGYHASKATDVYDFSSKSDSTMKTSFVHSQVTWFKVNEKSGFEPDLTIGKPELLEVKNHELLLDYPSKGFAYDGPCVAIEIKFLRNIERAGMQAHEDFLKFIDKLRPAKYQNIENENYRISKPENVAFISVVGCKDRQVYEKALGKLEEHTVNRKKEIGDNIFVAVFYQDEFTWAIKK